MTSPAKKKKNRTFGKVEALTFILQMIRPRELDQVLPPRHLCFPRFLGLGSTYRRKNIDLRAGYIKLRPVKPGTNVEVFHAEEILPRGS